MSYLYSTKFSSEDTRETKAMEVTSWSCRIARLIWLEAICGGQIGIYIGKFNSLNGPQRVENLLNIEALITSNIQLHTFGGSHGLSGNPLQRSWPRYLGAANACRTKTSITHVTKLISRHRLLCFQSQRKWVTLEQRRPNSRRAGGYCDIVASKASSHLDQVCPSHDIQLKHDIPSHGQINLFVTPRQIPNPPNRQSLICSEKRINAKFGHVAMILLQEAHVMAFHNAIKESPQPSQLKMI